MHPTVAAAHALITAIAPADALEATHRADTLHWLTTTDDVYRRIKPATPPRHLVSYVVPVAPADGAVLLVDHVNAGLWLPPGGHVDPGEHPGEHPADTAEREAAEEFGLTVTATSPLFLTVTRTVGLDSGHTDVSLWFPVPVLRSLPITPPEHGEFRSVRWWSRAELAAADPALFDPHLHRFTAKLAAGA
ncbi:NUDIX domain-containing protein [Spirilliplanes yamanashiensis]|uniref:DNA mismatch repair protein MutT n=1 Tax=Spirilliplanes yamanashiensis TaxID=42233 RepID=A0A8J4DLU6_9ACTN|nr:NUDIX domain-containing protein [Spirilliplanes yamanashiensis]MDP9816231.1 8-oxo-dGTP pyrophosphatase MutT (NUDIX family) [Spirilliplanes yamanashiensis]GIJ05758.1 DNA mismatch repair protein MutT [Spirilliplanes yamanashiensis]